MKGNKIQGNNMLQQKGTGKGLKKSPTMIEKKDKVNNQIKRAETGGKSLVPSANS